MIKRSKLDNLAIQRSSSRQRLSETPDLVAGRLRPDVNGAVALLSAHQGPGRPQPTHQSGSPPRLIHEFETGTKITMVLLPVLAAVRAGSLGAGLGGGGAGVGNYPAASLAYNVSPTGNGWQTKSTFSVQVCVPTLPAWLACGTHRTSAARPLPPPAASASFSGLGGFKCFGRCGVQSGHRRDEGRPPAHR